MQITSRHSLEAATRAETTSGTREYRLHASGPDDPLGGEVALLELSAQTTHTVSTGPRANGSILLDGQLDLLANGDVIPLAAGSILQTAIDQTYLLRTGDQPATLLSVYSAPAAIELPDTGVRTATIKQATETPAHNPQRGFFHMTARMLIDTANGGSATFTLGQGTFAPGGGCHALHRHPRAAEYFYVWSGSGVQLTEDGTEHPLHAGDLAYIPRNEWHGFKNTGPTPVRALFGYLGANSRESAGYELPAPR